MRNRSAIILFEKKPQITRINQDEPYAALPWDELEAIFNSLLADTIENACQLIDTDVLLYCHASNLSSEVLSPFRERIGVFELQDNSLSGQVQDAIENAFIEQYHRVLVLFDNHPTMNPKFLGKIIHQLEIEDDCVVVGFTNEGRLLFIAMKNNHSTLFENADVDPLTKSNTLLERLSELDVVVFPTPPSYFLDSGYNMARMKRDLETLDEERVHCPQRTLTTFRMLDKKYRSRKIVR